MLLRTRVAWWFVLLSALFYGPLPLSQGWAQVAPNPAVKEINNIFLPAPRNLRQNLTRAQKALEEQRFSDAVTELGEILNSPTSDDYFLGIAGANDAQLSLKTQAQQLLGGMPAKGRQLYELQYGAEARNLLDKALSEGNVQLLTDVTRRFFHTKAGYEATLLLGRWQLDQGRPLAGALTLKRVSDTPSALATYDPELSILLATCWIHAKMPEKAREVLILLKGRLPQTKVQLGEQSVSLFTSDDQALAWLEKIVGAGGAAKTFEASQWVMFRGNEARNASTSGSLPLLNYRWNLPTVNDPQDEARVKTQAKAQLDRGEPVISSVQPLAVSGMVLARTPDRLVGIDLLTGKRTWVYPWDDSSFERATKTSPQPSRAPVADQRNLELRQRLWEDNCFGQLSSDGEQVFLIDELSYAQVANYGGQARVFVGPNGRLMTNSSYGRPYNKLVALDLKKQGKLRWIVGGESGEDDPNLAGAFFLGAPLPLEDQLYVLAEFNGEIRLCCLNGKTGALEWKQSVALMEDPQQITFDSLRRLAGASPSYADGVLVCPTSGGAVVAIDRSTRSLRWGYQFARWDNTRIPGAFGFQTYRNPNSPSTHWLDSSVTVADGCVLLTPVESQELHCLDLLTGKARWPIQPRDNLLYVACVHEHQAIVVGKNRVEAIALADGKHGWNIPLDKPGDMPSGRGYYSDKYYYLPTTGRELLKLDLAEGKIVSRANTEIALGNLVCYQDEIVSQGSDWVAAFYQSEPLRERIDALLKTNPDDIWALTRQGEILLQEGQHKASLDSLWKAYRLKPAEDATRSMLVKVVLLLLKDDYLTHRDMAAEIEKLIDQPTQRRELLRLQAQGLENSGESWPAFLAYLALSDTAATVGTSEPGQLEPVDRQHSVRPDRWVQGRLYALYQAADETLRAKMAAEIAERLKQTLAADSMTDLRRFNAHFGFHPLAIPARLALANKLVAAEQFLEAEMLAGQLAGSSDLNLSGSATAVLAQVYEKSKRLDLAARAYSELGSRYAAVVCRGERTGRELAAEALASSALRTEVALQMWPTGRAEVLKDKEPPENPERAMPSQRITYNVPMLEFAGAAPRGMRAGYDPNNASLTLRDDLGRLLVAASLRSTDSPTRRIYSMPYNSLTAKVNGHLLVINMGSEIVGVDGLRSGRTTGEGLIWRQDTLDVGTTGQTNVYPQQKTVTTPLSGSRQVYYDPTGRLNFSTGPVTLSGLCFQKSRQLLCVDPLNGQTLWERGGFEATCEIFGDEELLFVVAPSSDEAQVLSAVDGSLLGKRKVPRAAGRWTTVGRRVLSWDQAGTKLTVQLSDIWQEGNSRELWSWELPLGSKGCLIDGEEVALLQPDGKLVIVSLADGKERLATTIVPEPNLAWLSVQRSRSQYVVIASGQAEASSDTMVQPIMNIAAQSAIVNGRVYAFDRTTGRSQWQTPAFVAQHGLPADQPAESPLLFFVRNLSSTRGNSKWRCSVLALDKRDGRLVLDEDNLTPNSAGLANNCEIAANPEQKTVTISVYTPQLKSIVVRLTDKPQPPAPPAQTGKLSSLSVGKPAGTVDSVIGAVIRAMATPAPRAPVGDPFAEPAPVKPVAPGVDPFR